MFLKNEIVFLFIKFLWIGFAFGLLSVVLKIISKIFRKNVVIVNLLMFIFVLVFGVVYLTMSFMFNNYSLSFVGFLGMLFGVVVIKISIDFFFDYFLRFIYNEFILNRRKRKSGELQASKKI